MIFVCGSVTPFLRRVDHAHLGKSHSKVILPKSEYDTKLRIAVDVDTGVDVDKFFSPESSRLCRLSRKPPSLIRLLSKSHKTRIVASISSIVSLDSRSGGFRRSDFMV